MFNFCVQNYTQTCKIRTTSNLPENSTGTQKLLNTSSNGQEIWQPRDHRCTKIILCTLKSVRWYSDRSFNYLSDGGGGGMIAFCRSGPSDRRPSIQPCWGTHCVYTVRTLSGTSWISSAEVILSWTWSWMSGYAGDLASWWNQLSLI